MQCHSKPRHVLSLSYMKSIKKSPLVFVKWWGSLKSKAFCSLGRTTTSSHHPHLCVTEVELILTRHLQKQYPINYALNFCYGCVNQPTWHLAGNERTLMSCYYMLNQDDDSSSTMMYIIYILTKLNPYPPGGWGGGLKSFVLKPYHRKS